MPQNKYLILSIYFVICLGFLQSQTYSIYGTVLDSETKKPISKVSIYIKNSDYKTSTDESGYFVLYLNNQLETHIDLNFKMIGYKIESLHLDLLQSSINLGEVYLNNQHLELESIHIHSHRHKLNQASDISLSGQNLNDNLTGNIATTLSNQSNIGVNSFGAVVSKPSLRGYSGDRFMLTKDGNETGDLSQSSIDHVIALDMAEVSTIEIIRGPKSLIFGSNAIGGIIKTSLITSPILRADKFLKRFFVGGESFNKGLYGNVLLYIPIKNNQINIFLSNRGTKNQSTPIGELENTYSETSNYQLGFTRYTKHGYLNFIIENFNMDYGIPPSLEGHINGVDIELIKKAFQINYHQDISFYNFNQFDIKYNFIDYEHKEYEYNSDFRAVGLAKNTHNTKIELRTSHSIIGSEINFKHFFSEGFYWTPDTHELNFSIYSFYEKSFHHFNLLSSVRMGHFLIALQENNLSFSNLNERAVRDRKFYYFSSSIGLKKTMDKFNFDVWFMNTMKPPRVEELYSDGPHLGTYSYEIGAPYLGLEKIYGIESSIGYDASPVNLSLTGFYNYSPYYYQMLKMGECEGELIDGDSHPCAGADFIEWGSGPFGWLYKYQTQGVESVIKGLEFNVNYSYQKFDIEYDFSLVRGDDLTSNRPLSYINPDKQILNIGYRKNKISYKVRLSKTHSQYRLGEFETYTPSSFLVDFVIGYNQKDKNITIQFNNILNEEYYNHLSRIKSIMPEAGRNIMISYKVLF
tara:strand:+ start:4302 stop:6542 length:2241 start_codon:yes stop_codon:yes gene_type:complete